MAANQFTNSRRRLIVAHLEHAKIVPEGIERDQVGVVSSFFAFST